jgi:hypothetical protein
MILTPWAVWKVSFLPLVASAAAAELTKLALALPDSDGPPESAIS